MIVIVEHILSATWKEYGPPRTKNLFSLFLSYKTIRVMIFLSINVSETKTALYLYEMMDANETYCGDHFITYVNQTIMLHTLNLDI